MSITTTIAITMGVDTSVLLLLTILPPLKIAITTSLNLGASSSSCRSPSAWYRSLHSSTSEGLKALTVRRYRQLGARQACWDQIRPCSNKVNMVACRWFARSVSCDHWHLDTACHPAANPVTKIQQRNKWRGLLRQLRREPNQRSASTQIRLASCSSAVCGSGEDATTRYSQFQSFGTLGL